MAEESGGGLLSPLLLFAAMGLFMYALLIRPQQRREKQHRQMLTRIQKGDSIVTNGGIHGRVTGVTDDVLTVEISNGVRVKLNKSAVGSLQSQDGEKS